MALQRLSTVAPAATVPLPRSAQPDECPAGQSIPPGGQAAWCSAGPGAGPFGLVTQFFAMLERYTAGTHDVLLQACTVQLGGHQILVQRFALQNYYAVVVSAYSPFF